MAADDFDDRLALLEEHIVQPEETAEDYLRKAEELLAQGLTSRAGFYLNLARIARTLDELDEEDDDDA